MYWFKKHMQYIDIMFLHCSTGIFEFHKYFVNLFYLLFCVKRKQYNSKRIYFLPTRIFSLSESNVFWRICYMIFVCLYVSMCTCFINQNSHQLNCNQNKLPLNHLYDNILVTKALQIGSCHIASLGKGKPTKRQTIHFWSIGVVPPPPYPP